MVDWNAIDKYEYINAIMGSEVSTVELKYLLLHKLSDYLTQTYLFKGVDISYYNEGFNLYQTGEL